MTSPAVGAGAAQWSRLYFLDWIRVLALFAVFLDHAIGGVPGILPSFMPGWGGTFLGVVAALGITLFFTVSGAASIFSLERRSSKQYLRERVVRLAIPFLVGGAVLVPLAQYLGPFPSESSWWEACAAGLNPNEQRSPKNRSTSRSRSMGPGCGCWGSCSCTQ